MASLCVPTVATGYWPVITAPLTRDSIRLECTLAVGILPHHFLCLSASLPLFSEISCLLSVWNSLKVWQNSWNLSLQTSAPAFLCSFIWQEIWALPLLCSNDRRRKLRHLSDCYYPGRFPTSVMAQQFLNSAPLWNCCIRLVWGVSFSSLQIPNYFFPLDRKWDITVIREGNLDIFIREKKSFNLESKKSQPCYIVSESLGGQRWIWFREEMRVVAWYVLKSVRYAVFSRSSSGKLMNN